MPKPRPKSRKQVEASESSPVMLWVVIALCFAGAVAFVIWQVNAQRAAYQATLGVKDSPLAKPAEPPQAVVNKPAAEPRKADESKVAAAPAPAAPATPPAPPAISPEVAESATVAFLKEKYPESKNFECDHALTDNLDPFISEPLGFKALWFTTGKFDFSEKGSVAPHSATFRCYLDAADSKATVQVMSLDERNTFVDSSKEDHKPELFYYLISAKKPAQALSEPSAAIRRRGQIQASETVRQKDAVTTVLEHLKKKLPKPETVTITGTQARASDHNEVSNYDFVSIWEVTGQCSYKDAKNQPTNQPFVAYLELQDTVYKLHLLKLKGETLEISEELDRQHRLEARAIQKRKEAMEKKNAQKNAVAKNAGDKGDTDKDEPEEDPAEKKPAGKKFVKQKK